jgi:actin-like ATPase involved in cell morphogenesis
VVVLREDGEVLVGEAAERRAASQPERTAREFKRRLGDPIPIVIGGTPYGAESLIAHVIAWVLERATAELGAPPGTVALSHPASWSTYKTDLLVQAARQAGVSDVVLITEPEAAAVHYAEQDRLATGATVAVYDLGGGTFDAAVVRRHADRWELVGMPEGLERFGGLDLDQAVFAHVDRSLDGMLSELDTSDPAVRSGLMRLREECRRAKEALSNDIDTDIAVVLPSITTEVRLTRAELESMIRPRVADTVDALTRCARSAGVATSDLDRILLVGGSSRVPLVAEMVRQTTGVRVAVDTNPKLAIAYGAALVGARQRGGSVAPELVSAAGEEPAPPTVAATPESVATMPSGSAPLPPPPTAVSDSSAQPSGSNGLSRSTFVVLAGVVAVIALIVGVVLGLGGGSDAPASNSPADTETAPPTTPPTTTAATTPPTTALATTTPPTTPPTTAPATTPPTTAPTTPPTTGPPTGSANDVPPMERLTDASQLLSAEVPVAWTSRLTNPAAVGDVLAVQVSASPDQAGFAALSAPGITILASDSADAAAPDELLATLATAFGAVCSAQPPESFSIAGIIGVSQRFENCRGSAASTVVHVGTNAAGVTFLANGVLFTPPDEAAYARSLATIEVAQ